MSIGANDHGCLFDLLRIIGLDDIDHIKTAQRRIAVFPPDARALLLISLDTFAASFLKSLGSRKASGDKRLRMM